MAKNVSNNFKNIIKNGGPFYSYAVMTLADGTVIELSSENDFTISGSGYSEDSESGFPLGSALSKAITLNLDNTVTPEPLQDTVSDDILDTQNDEILTERKSKNYDYYYARIVLYTEADLPDGTTERIQEGIFTVIDSVTPGDVLEINAYDDMYKADVEFVSSLTYPVPAQMLLNEVCSKCDITLGSATFKNNNFQIQQAPEGLTGRQVIGYIAQIAVGNAVIDSTGHLVIKSYDFSAFDVEEDVTAGEVETDSGIHIISEYTSDPDIGTDDITITGVSVTIESEDSDEEDETYIVGSEEYAISVDNPLITGQEKTAIDLIAESIIGITIRPFSGDFMPDPTVEFMDLAYVVDRNDVIYKTFITTHDFNYLGSSTFSCGIESPERHGSSYYSTASEAYQKAKNDIKVNKTQWEQAIENLSQQVANASGLYTTEETQPDGSTIFYMHNKPALEESDIVWKMTAETLTVSTDGGKTWNAGITVNGEVIAQIMNTIGINFDWGVGGTLIIQDKDGNQTAYIDAETGTIRFAVQSLTITGKTVQEIAAEESDNTLNNFVNSVYTLDIDKLQAQIDGQIETWFYDYVPTISNYPASEWTTDTEKDKHLGDLFYIVDNEEYGGQAYRWAKINNAYTWDYVEDTAVTKALSDAAAAQDTADQKRRVFITTPVPPYDVGDLWAQGEDGDLLRCISSRASGIYSISDWDLASKYTDDTNLNVFINGDYADTIKSIEDSIDQKAETWYQSTDPALDWQSTVSSPLQDISGEDITDTTGSQILTLWEKDKYIHDGDLWKDSTTNVEYIYKNGEWVEMPIPDDVFDTIDGKAQIFINQPVPPYSIGDLWFNSSTSDIMTCVVERQTGSYVSSDWQKRNKYTDDTYAEQIAENLNNFADQVTGDIDSLQEQIDGKIETYYYNYQPTLTNVPASNWTTAEERQKHIGDLFYWQSKGYTYRFTQSGNDFVWQSIQDSDISEALNAASNAQDTADGKRRVFVSTPKPPYDVGDLWTQGADGDIMRCKTARQTGSYVSSDWILASKYTDDTYAQSIAKNLENFANQVTSNIENIKDEIDGKIDTYFGNYVPSSTNEPASGWSETEKPEHVNDLFYNKSTGKVYVYTQAGLSLYVWQELQDEDIQTALEDAAAAQDTADGKRRVFTTTPSPPYDIGDLWAQGSTGDLMRCTTARQTGSYVSSDWVLATKYTDDSAVEQLDESLNQTGVFNRLTNNGQSQGIYMEGNSLYVNAQYIGTGMISDVTGRSFWNLDTGDLQLSGDFIQRADNGALSVAITENQLKLYSWDDDGKYVGSVGSVKNLDTGRTGVEMWCDKGERVILGCANTEGSDADIKTIFSYDDQSPDDTPYIINTVTGTLFSNNPNGGITVEHGLIKSWNIRSVLDDTLTVLTGLRWNSNTGVINRMYFVDIEVKNGLICSWTSRYIDY